jgi:hypothetical protein
METGGDKMTGEVAFNAAKSVYTMYGAFFKAVAQEIGMDRALALHAEYGEAWSAVWAEMLKRKDVEKELKEMAEGMGFSVEVEASPSKIVNRVYQCPCYEGFKASGLDHETIKAMCHRMTEVDSASLKKLVPNASSTLKKFRSTPNDYCQEEIEIRK